MNTIIVKQTTGTDTIVNYWFDANTLNFETEQALMSKSERAWNAKDAMEKFAHPQGYFLKSIDNHSAVFIYDRLRHQFQTEFEVANQIKTNQEYIDAAKEISARSEIVQDYFGQQIYDLKKQIRELENQAKKEFDELTENLRQAQVAVLNNICPDSKQTENMQKPIKRFSFDHYILYK